MNAYIGDILDRYSILLLKLEHNPDVISHKEERIFLQNEMCLLKKKYPNINLDLFLDYIKKINNEIWNLEADIRKGALDNDLIEIGRRAVTIRKINGLRVGFKNLINELLGEGFREVKIDHISQ